MNKKLFFFDVDETLYDNKNQSIPLSTINSIKVLAKHHTLAIATGRPIYLLQKINPILKYFNYFVSLNGQYISSKNSTIFKSPMNNIYKLIEVLIKENISFGMAGENERVLSHIDEYSATFFKHNHANYPKINKDFYKTNNVYLIWIFHEKLKIRKIVSKFIDYQLIQWGETFFDIIPKNTSKGEGVKKLVEYLKYDVNDCFAFGDALNDYEMLSYIKNSIAMGNAHPKIKQVCAYTTSHIENDGIRNALVYYGFIK